MKKIRVSLEDYPFPRGGPLTETEREMRRVALQRELDARWEAGEKRRQAESAGEAA